jgi:hypothetical protein
MFQYRLSQELEGDVSIYYLEQHEKALEVFANAIDLKTLDSKVPASSVRIRVERLLIKRHWPP